MTSAPDIVSTLTAAAAYAHAIATLKARHDRTVQDVVTLTEIPSPPFGEAARGKAYETMLRAHGLQDVTTRRSAT